MSARRALPEGFEDAFAELTSAAPRRALIDSTLTEPQSYSAPRYALEETLVDAFRLELDDKPKAAKGLRRQRSASLIAAGAALACLLVVPGAMSASNASPQRAVLAVQQNSAAAQDELLTAPLAAHAKAADEAAEQARAAEEARLAEQARQAEEARLAEEARKAEEARLAEEARQAEEAKAAEQARLAANARSAEQPRPALNQAASGQAAPAAAPVAAPQPAGTCWLGPADPRVTAQTAAVYYDVCSKFGGFSSVGGWRGTADDHGAGRALDFMISGPAGWEIANYLTANAAALGIDYVIYEQQIWGTWAPGWKMMENRGSVTANHFDHVHVSVKY